MSACVLCSAGETTAHAVGPRDETVDLCEVCAAGVAGSVEDTPHWLCLNEAIWSTEPAVQVLSYRLLHKLEGAVWARDLLEIAYLEPDVLAWAEDGMSDAADQVPDVVHRDTNGVVLAVGDNVVLIKDLPVKGAGFTAKRGTAVRGISLVADNAGHIEGRVEGQRIVILTEFVKKS